MYIYVFIYSFSYIISCIYLLITKKKNKKTKILDLVEELFITFYGLRRKFLHLKVTTWRTVDTRYHTFLDLHCSRKLIVLQIYLN